MDPITILKSAPNKISLSARHRNRSQAKQRDQRRRRRELNSTMSHYFTFDYRANKSTFRKIYEIKVVDN